MAGGWRLVGKWGEYEPWVRALKGKSGAYLIRRRITHDMLYIGESHTGRLYETLTRHFQHWDGRTSGRVYMHATVEVRVVLASPARAMGLQDRLICKYSPSGNRSNPCEDLPF